MQQGGADTSGSALALLLLIAAVVGWLGIRAMIRQLRAGKTQAAVHGDFTAYALEALANAARIDGRIKDTERAAILACMSEITGAAFDAARVEAALREARLNKAELVAYLQAHANAFTREQKMHLLKALLAVLTADQDFDEAEHDALVDYTSAVGFDRQTAPQMLRRLAGDFSRGNIT